MCSVPRILFKEIVLGIVGIVGIRHTCMTMRIGVLLFVLCMAAGPVFGQTLRFEYAPIHYHSRPVTNSISALALNQLIFEPEQSYLKSILKALEISPESQVLVFRSTSFQKNRITPKTPRAIYFNDTTYVGWIPGADLLEIISIDPFLGPVFYEITQDSAPGLEITRNNTDCLNCHSSAKTQSVPGLFIRSSYPKGGGRVAGRTTSHQTDFSKRWGGWYVTGLTGGITHRVNQPVELPTGIDAHLNLINRANYRVRLVMHDEGVDPNDPDAELPERVVQEILRHAPAVVRNFLFMSKAALEGPLAGNSGFAAYFEELGPRDKQGRSLREFDGHKRLFKYSCSYMIYSPSFTALPPAFKQEAFRMLFDILTTMTLTEDYTHLMATDKKAIYEILKSTVPDLSNVWK